MHFEQTFPLSTVSRHEKRFTGSELSVFCLESVKSSTMQRRVGKHEESSSAGEGARRTTADRDKGRTP